MMKKRKFGIGLLLMLAVVVTTGTFAYWASSIAGDDQVENVTVVIGTGSSFTTTLDVTTDTADNNNLLPTSRIVNTGDDRTTYTFPVIWEVNEDGSTYDGATGELSVTVTYSMAGSGLDSAQLDAMFSINDITNVAITEGVSQNVDVTLIFDTEPVDEATYNAIKGGTLTLTLTFTVDTTNTSTTN